MHPAKLLLVEDESIVALDLSQQLQDMGYEVCAIADNGADAIALTRRHRPSLVLMDIVIKGDIDGIETARVIERDFKVPVVFLTAYSDLETLERAVQTQPYAYITKPFQPKEVRAAISVALHKSASDQRMRESERWFRSTYSTAANDGFFWRLMRNLKSRLRWARRRPVLR
jgi:CheY-like chemotaxis protein